MDHLVSKATQAAMKRAKYLETSEVSHDHLLIGILQTISRFNIVKIGSITIDLADFGNASVYADTETSPKTDQIKVAYSSSANAILDKAAYIARIDQSKHIEIVHILVAYANQENGLMAKLKKRYNFTDRQWRVALSAWQPALEAPLGKDSKATESHKTARDLDGKQFFSPDEAAEYLGLHVQTIRGYIRTGKLPALRLAGERALRIEKSALLNLLEPFNPEEK